MDAALGAIAGAPPLYVLVAFPEEFNQQLEQLNCGAAPAASQAQGPEPMAPIGSQDGVGRGPRAYRGQLWLTFFIPRDADPRRGLGGCNWGPTWEAREAIQRETGLIIYLNCILGNSNSYWSWDTRLRATWSGYWPCDPHAESQERNGYKKPDYCISDAGGGWDNSRRDQGKLLDRFDAFVKSRYPKKIGLDLVLNYTSSGWLEEVNFKRWGVSQIAMVWILGACRNGVAVQDGWVSLSDERPYRDRPCEGDWKPTVDHPNKAIAMHEISHQLNAHHYPDEDRVDKCGYIYNWRWYPWADIMNYCHVGWQYMKYSAENRDHVRTNVWDTTGCNNPQRTIWTCA